MSVRGADENNTLHRVIFLNTNDLSTAVTRFLKVFKILLVNQNFLNKKMQVSHWSIFPLEFQERLIGGGLKVRCPIGVCHVVRLRPTKCVRRTRHL